MDCREIFIAVANMFFEISNWFYDLLNYSGLSMIYYTAIFTVMTSGFLLSRFGSALSIGSDKAAQHIKRKGEK